MIDETLTALTDIKMPITHRWLKPAVVSTLTVPFYQSTAATRWFWAVARQDGELPSS